MQIHEILAFLDQKGVNYTFQGDADVAILSFCPLLDLHPEAMTWVRAMDGEICERLNRAPSVLAFCDVGQCENLPLTGNVILVDNPHRVFFEVLIHFFYHPEPPRIAETAVIESKNVGRNLVSGHHTFVGNDVVLGDDCVLGNNVSIEGKVRIGDRVHIDSGCRIGVCGFGHFINEDGTNTRIPHLGSVVIGSDTKIGANSVVAAGTLGPTGIGSFVLIDGLCYVAHNARVGDRVFVAGGSGIAGSAVVEDDVWISPRCVVNSGATVGSGTFIAMGSIVTTDVPSGQYASGSPAVVRGPVRKNKYKI